jgi:hypothetical protein
MNKKIQINTASSVQLDKIQFEKLYKTSNGIIKTNVNYNSKDLLIKGPSMFFGHDIAKCGDDFYIDLVFDKKCKKNTKFYELVKSIDFLVISEIFENAKLWYPDLPTEPSLCQIESEYISTIKLSTMHADQSSLKLRTKADKIEFYDGDNAEVPFQLLKANFPTIPLLHLSHVYKENNHIWAEWEIVQLKTNLPEKIFGGCQLLDVEENSEEDEQAEDENPDFY